MVKPPLHCVFFGFYVKDEHNGEDKDEVEVCKVFNSFASASY